MIEQGMETVSTEIRVIEDEQRALTRFLSRLRGIDTSRVQSAPKRDPVQNSVVSISNCNHQSAASQEQTSMQKEVADAYRETVVEMDHYEEEYGNPIPEDIALEFGRQAAHMVFLKENLTSTDLQYLVSAAEKSLQERKQHARELDRERDSLEQCDVELTDIETRFFDCPDPTERPSSFVVSIRNDLIELEQRCQALVTKRQDVIHARTDSSLRGVDEQSLNQYLYGQNLSVTCPVVHDTVSLIQNLKTQQERCERILANASSAGARSASELKG